MDQKKQLGGAYDTGFFLEGRYKVEPLKRVASEFGAIGAARFEIDPSFEPEKIVTFLFGPNSVSIEGVRGQAQGWSERMIEPGIREPLPRVSWITRLRAEPKYSSLPGPFGSWEAFSRRAIGLPSCSTLVCDGCIYQQSILVKNRIRRAEWFNPDKEEFPDQAAMIGAYTECIERAGMGELLELVEPYFFLRPESFWEYAADIANLVDRNQIDEARAEAAELTKGMPDFTVTEFVEAVLASWDASRKERVRSLLLKAGLPV